MGIYTGGSNYNPAQILRDQTVVGNTSAIDSILEHIESKSYQQMPIEALQNVVGLIMPDPSKSQQVWDSDAIIGSLGKYSSLKRQDTGYIYVDRDRRGEADRRETQGIIEGGELRSVPQDKVVLFMLRIKAENGGNAAWWPQVRFPDGRYGFAFAV